MRPDDITSGMLSSDAPPFSAARTPSAVASAADRLARTRDSSVDSSESCWVASTELFWPTSRSECERKAATFDSASFTRRPRSAISGSSHWVASALDCDFAACCTAR